MEDRALQYMNGLIDTLEQAGGSEAAELLRRARQELAEAQWCEMTDSLLQAIQDPLVLNFGYDLHENVLRFVCTDISPVAYVKLLYSICFSRNVTPRTALEVIDTAVFLLSTDSCKQGVHAARCIRALLLLDRRYSGNGTVSEEASAQEARNILDDVESFIHSKQMHEVEPILAALHCRARGKDYEMRLQYTQYYHNSFEIVKSAKLAEMPILEADMMALAYTTAVAALLSEEIYNFGKFLNHQCFTERLSTSPEHSWILEWLRICNEGRVEEFEECAMARRAEIESNPALLDGLQSIMHKVRLMALLHLVFYTSFNERTFSFDVIARRCAVSLDNVEPLLLAALAQGIIIGKIDGLTQEVHITWVESRVLSLQEVKELAVHMSSWKDKVMKLSRFVADATKETP
uniref:Putative 19S proteasome regulatory subunit n=1 Tax=Trypanosoma congolense (strain IL3000) TaxID=1068625 RepID=G0UYV0_TRYCI|nr:putative 19S proteasome regulatory subunit [Trypanosoma congolense IL3000]